MGLNKLDVVAGHAGERAESPGAVLASPGAGRGAASRTPREPEPGAALHSRQRCQAAGEAEKHRLTAPTRLSVQTHRFPLEVGSPCLSLTT